MDVKDIILAASIAKGAGGSGGGVTKEYVDTQVGTVSERVDDVEDVIPSTATAQNKLATSADVLGNSIPSTSTTSPIIDSADGLVQGLTIYGKSEVVDGAIKSVGEGYAVVRLEDLTWNYNANGNYFFTNPANIISAQTKPLCDKYSTKLITVWSEMDSDKLLGLYPQSDFTAIRVNDYSYTTVSDFVASLGDATLCYELADPTQGNIIAAKTDDGTGIDGTMATFATALPLRSTLDGTTRDELIIGNGKAEAITRCEVVDDNIVPLATPVTTPLTDAEVSAFRQLRTYNSTTNVTITDDPEFEIDYLKNSDNGQAVADIQRDLQGQIDEVSSDTTEVLSEIEILAQINDRIYQGTDLTIKFADEISASPYNGDPWAWIKARIQANNFAGIHVCDYIPVTTTNSVTLNAQIAGINTYKNYGDSAVGSHIDFICKELWSTLHPINPVNFNNGTATQNYPWLASDLYLYLNSLAGTAPSAAEVGGGTGTAVDYTADGVYYFLPTQLKNVIIEKKFLFPTRYSASGLLSDDNSWVWKNIGKLWLPNECEVYGMPVWGGKGGYSLGGSALQYPLFAGNMNRLKFRNGSRYHWWLLSPDSGSSTDWCYVNLNSSCNSSGASNSGIAAPVCFRVG